MDGWYYKLFDSEFGPVKFDELVSLAKNNTLSRSDHVRFGESGLWRAAGSIGNLMAHFPFQAVEKVISVSTMTPPSESFVIDDAEDQLSIDDFAISESSEVVSVPDDIQVRVPVQAQQRTTARKATVTQPVQSSRSVEERSAPERPREERSRDAAPPAGQKTKSSDSRWWCMIKDKEYGPIDLKKLTEWASTGRLHRHDYVRYGLEAYVRADELPQLFPKLPNQLEETEEADEAPPSKPEDLMDFLTGAPTAAATTPKKPAAAVSPSPAPVAPRLAPTPAPVAPPPQPSLASVYSTSPTAGLSGPSIATMGMGAGAAGFGGSNSVRASVPARPPAAKKSSGPGIGATLMSPAVLGGVGGVVGLVGLYFLITSLGLLTSADAGRVKEMAAIVKEISTARSKSKVSTDAIKPLADKAGTLGQKYGRELKGTKDKKSKKVLALANALEELSTLDLGKPSDDEKKANEVLSKVKTALAGAKKDTGVK